MTESHVENHSGREVPAANQHKDEPVETAPESSPMSDSDSIASNDPQAPSLGGGPAPTAGGTPSGAAGPGDPQGVKVPSTHAAAGTSEGSEEIQGVRQDAIVSPGKPDGEVDTRA